MTLTTASLFVTLYQRACCVLSLRILTLALKGNKQIMQVTRTVLFIRDINNDLMTLYSTYAFLKSQFLFFLGGGELWVVCYLAVAFM